MAMGVVEKVFVSFLPVGHTHEDIDQTFSRTSVHLRAVEALTLESMATELKKSFTPAPSVSRLAEIANFSGLCIAEKCLYDPNPGHITDIFE